MSLCTFLFFLFFFFMIPLPLGSTLFPYTTLFRSFVADALRKTRRYRQAEARYRERRYAAERRTWDDPRSEEHTSELQSPCNLVCRLLLEKKKKKTYNKKHT